MLLQRFILFISYTHAHVSHPVLSYNLSLRISCALTFRVMFAGVVIGSYGGVDVGMDIFGAERREGMGVDIDIKKGREKDYKHRI
jgi:hypothetical protein